VDIRQHYTDVLGTYSLFGLRRTLEHVPQVFLLLDLLSLHGLVVRYWEVLGFFQVARVLRGFNRGPLSLWGFKRGLTLFLRGRCGRPYWILLLRNLFVGCDISPNYRRAFLALSTGATFAGFEHLRLF
jgi:hypothetical protein